MNLYTKCNHCGKRHRVRKTYSTRINFKMYEGSEYKAQCKHCSKEISQEINNVYATYSYYRFLVISLVVIIGTIYAYRKVTNYSTEFTPMAHDHSWYLLPLFPAIILLIYRGSEKSKIITFNSLKV